MIPWTVAYQTSLSMGFPRQEYWSGLPFLSTDLPDPRIEFASLMSPALAGGFFTTSAIWEAWGSAIYKPVQKYFNILTPENFNHSAYQLYISPGPRRTLLAIYSVSTPSTDIENS